MCTIHLEVVALLTAAVSQAFKFPGSVQVASVCVCLCQTDMSHVHIEDMHELSEDGNPGDLLKGGGAAGEEIKKHNRAKLARRIGAKVSTITWQRSC